MIKPSCRARTRTSYGLLRAKSCTFSDSVTIPAGELCDFEYRNVFTIVDNAVIFGDPENPDRVIVQETQYNTHINLDTGYALGGGSRRVRVHRS